MVARQVTIHFPKEYHIQRPSCVMTYYFALAREMLINLQTYCALRKALSMPCHLSFLLKHCSKKSSKSVAVSSPHDGLPLWLGVIVKPGMEKDWGKLHNTSHVQSPIKGIIL